jgi:hypothetical protein
MYVEGLKALLAKVTEVVEDLWIERECYRDIILSANRATEDQLKEYAETAKNDPRHRAEAREGAGTRGTNAPMRSNFRRRPVTWTESRQKSLVRLARLPGTWPTGGMIISLRKEGTFGWKCKTTRSASIDS